MENTLLESFNELLNTDLFSSKVRNIFNEGKSLIFKNETLQEEKEKLNEILILTLKALIGKNIYWACPGWKIETHVITNIDYRIYESDFYDKKYIKYKGKKCIVIEVDNDGDYLANFIGKTLFFDKESAMKHIQEETE